MNRLLSKRIINPFSTLVLAEHNAANISKNSLKLFSCAHNFAEEVLPISSQVHVLLTGNGAKASAEALKSSIKCSHLSTIHVLEAEHP